MKLKTTFIILLILLTVTLASAENNLKQSRHPDQNLSVSPVKNNVHNLTLSEARLYNRNNANSHQWWFPPGLVPNPNATDPTFAQVVNFIKADPTDKKLYVSGVYECDSMARDVYNNASKAGIRVGLVDIWLQGEDDQYDTCYNTTDKGLVFIDCTGDPTSGCSGCGDCDCIVNVTKGIIYHPHSLYSPYCRDYTQGQILDYKIEWSSVNFTGTVPVAQFTANKTTGNAPLTVKFTDTSTRSPTSWHWSFGDGQSATTQNPAYNYSNAGNYSVVMVASNSYGQSQQSSPKTITVTSTGTIPVAKFSTAPLTVNFTDKSTGSPTSWHWFFGDGTSSTQENPTHTYSNAGNYNVVMVAINNIGQSASVQDTVIVT